MDDRASLDCLHWRRLRNNAGDSDSHYLLALATLGIATLIETILSVLHRPRWPMQVLFHVAVAVIAASVIT